MWRRFRAVRGKTWGRLAAGYLVVLLVSHIAGGRPPTVALTPDRRMAAVQAFADGKRQPRMIQVAYRDTAPESERIPIILIHGSPGSGDVMLSLGKLLSPKFRVIVPDLPGFGASTHDLPEYSFRGHADFLIQLIDGLHLTRAHVLGFSRGGAVALSMADAAPDRIASIVMLSALGVQEHELLGGHAANHALHGAQVGILWLLQNGVPHFGLFWEMPFTMEYARNFYDSDQRPLRAILERYRGPMLIIHGVNDRNVPVEAAREHHRLVPQSELVEIDGDHFLAFQNPALFLDPLVRFLQQADGAR